MRFANHANRLILIAPDAGDELDGLAGIDVHTASEGRIPAEPERAFDRWQEVLSWARQQSAQPDVVVEPARLRAPSPRPRQVFGIGVNYADHGAEADMAIPETPLVFTKLSTAITGPFDPIPLSTATVDWEVEIAVVIGVAARNVTRETAWEHVAGLTTGQDLSDREIQWRPAQAPQFSLGKSLAGFAPLGPLLATPDEYPDADDIALSCRLNGEEVQRSRSAQMLVSVPEIISYLSSILALLPGDVIFTGTPAGIGMTRTPPRYLVPGDRLESWVQAAGTMSHTFTAVSAEAPAAR
jgi:2,4-diketo-3-deoxy-L-fuconate hydrolase